MTCLDDETVLGLVEGRLAEAVLVGVEQHLDDCETCRDVIAHVSRAQSPAHVLERGQTIGRYVIGDVLGSGAMGRVYSAWQPELDRRVAIKVLHEDAPGGRDRLVREAQAMARLDHPNIVGVHEVGTTDDGVYVAMDLVEGETLRAWAERSRPWREVVRVLIDVARGLAAVHAAGVIHRDVKPDNIIIGADGRARLGDFGLARAGKQSADTSGSSLAPPETSASRPLRRTADGSSSPQNRATAISASPGTPASPRGRATVLGGPLEPRVGATAIAGTPAYMAPEVLRGGVATPASDQFGFAVTAYEILAGKRPFEGRTWAELSRAVERGSIPTLRAVPAWLDGAIRKSLAVEPTKRFASLGAVADLLADRLHRRKPATWIAGAAAAAAIASGATWLASRDSSAGASCELGATEVAEVWNPSVRGRLDSLGAPTISAIDRWAAAWAIERDATCTAAHSEPAPKVAARQRCLDQHRTALAALLDRAAKPGAAKPGDAATPKPATAKLSNAGPTDQLDDAAPEIGDRMIDALAALSPADCRFADAGTADPLPLDPDRAAQVHEVERALPPVRAAIALGDARPSVSVVAKIVELARKTSHAPTLAEALLVQADALRETGRLADAATAARDSVAAAERGHDDQTAARAWIARVTIAGDRRELAGADDLAAIATASIDRAGARPRLVAQLLRLRALVSYNRGQLEEARKLLVDARVRFVTLSGERSVDVAAIEAQLGSTARAAGDLDAAEQHHRNALAIDRELRGPRHPDVARDLHNLAGVLRLRGDLDRAFATYNEALAIEVATRGERSSEAGLTHNSLGLVELARRNWAGARKEFALALDLLSAAGSGDRAFAEHNLGLVAAATGNHAEALEHYDRAAAIYAATIGDDAMGPVRLYLDRARSIAARSGIDAARPDAKRAIDAANRAQIAWIAEDAQALLDDPKHTVAQAPHRPAVDVSVEPVARPDRPLTQPIRAAVPAVPSPPATKPPRPPRDVGTYGPSQN